MSGDVLFYWIVVPAIKIALVMAILPLMVALFTYAERKVIAFIQVRLGPMRVGPKGILQPIADVLKLFLKEDIVPSKANAFIFILAPILAIIPAFVAVSVLPFGPEVPGWGELWYFKFWLVPLANLCGADVTQPLAMAITDLDIGLLFLVSISSLGVFSILFAGWASNSKYPLLGGLRSAAQLISYEVPLGFALIAGLLMTQTLSMNGIVLSQMQLGWSLLWLQPISLVIYFIAGVAETNRVPFDLPEAETELVAGFHTEYSGMKFAFFFLAEYINMITVAAVAVTLFLGGWLPPLHGLLTHVVDGVRVPREGFLGDVLFSPPAAFFFFVAKIAVVYYLYFWLRATLPRYRYDQLMNLGWKFLIPLSMLNLFLVGINVVVHGSLGLPNFALVGLALVNIVTVLAVVHMLRSGKARDGKQALGTAQ